MPTVCFFKKTFLRAKIFIHPAVPRLLIFVQFRYRLHLFSAARKTRLFSSLQKPFCTPVFHCVSTKTFVFHPFSRIITVQIAVLSFLRFCRGCKKLQRQGCIIFCTLFCSPESQKTAVLTHRGSEEHLIQSGRLLGTNQQDLPPHLQYGNGKWGFASPQRQDESLRRH